MSDPFYIAYASATQPRKVFAINPEKFDNDIWTLVEHCRARMFGPLPDQAHEDQVVDRIRAQQRALTEARKRQHDDAMR